jgi:hypothetical protein
MSTSALERIKARAYRTPVEDNHSSKGASSNSALERIKEKAYGGGIDHDTFKSWFSDAETTIKGFNDYAKANEGKWVGDYGREFNDSISGLMVKKDVIRDYLTYNYKPSDEGSAFDRIKSKANSSYSSLLKVYEDYVKYLTEAEKYSTSRRELYSQFGSDEEYKKAIADAEAWQKDYDEKMSYDLEAGKREADQLNNILGVYDEISRLKSDIQTLSLAASKGGYGSEGIREEIAQKESRLEAMERTWAHAMEVYGSYDSLKTLASEKNQYYTLAKRVQDSARLGGVSNPESEYYDPNFEKYATLGNYTRWEQVGSMTADKDAGGILAYDDVKAAALVMNERWLSYELFKPEMRSSQDGFAGWISNTFGNAAEYNTENIETISIFRTMTDEEINTFAYYLAKDKENGTNLAEQYVAGLRDTLNTRRGKEISSEKDTLLEKYLFAAYAGLKQYEEGRDALFSDADYIPTSPTQYASGYIREDLDGEGIPVWYNFNEGEWENEILGSSTAQIGYDAINTTSNMLPSVLASVIVDAALPGAGSWVGAVSMGMGAAGNAKAEMLRLGYSKQQANSYGIMVGVSEAALEKVLGGIPGLSNGDGIFSSLGQKILGKVDNAFARVAITIGGNMADEALEEGLQTILEPWLKEMATSVDWDSPTVDEVLYSSLLGAISSIGFGGAGAVQSQIQSNAGVREHGQAIIDNGGVDALKDLALEMYGKQNDIKGSIGVDLASKVGAKATPKNVGKLSDYMGKTIASQNEAALTKALVEKGLSGKVATKVAKYIMGNELSEADVATIEGSTRIQKAMDEVLADSNLDISDATIRLNNARGGIKATTASEAVAEQAEKASVAKSEADFENATEAKFEASADGKTIYKDVRGIERDVEIKRIASTEGGIKVELESGETVKANDISFSTQEEAVMYEMVARMEASADTANEIISTFKPKNLAEATRFLTTVPLAYTYGKMGYEAGLKNVAMPDNLRKIVYNRGRMDAMLQDKANTKTAKNGGTGVSVKKDGIIFENGYVYDESGANELQKASMAGIEVIRKMSNLEVHVFESRVVNGKRVAYVNGKLVPAPNGYYMDGNKIYIDINAGKDGEGAMLYTMSHEVGHYIREWNAKGFRELGDFLLKEYGKQGVPVNALLEDQKKKIRDRYKRNGETLPSVAKLNDMAYEELVCDAMSDMFADEKAYEKLAKLKAQNKTLWEKLGEAIKALIDKLKTALGVYKEKDVAVAQEAYEVRGFSKEAYEKLQDLYLKAFVEADENYGEAISKEEIITDGAVVVDESGKKFSIRSMKHDISDGKMFRDLMTYCGFTQEQTTELRHQLEDLVEYMNPFRDILDLNESYGREGRRYSPYKPNSDPLYTISLDYSTQCSKRLLTQYVIEQLQLQENRPMSAEEQMAIRDMLKEYGKVEKGLQVACVMCYVEAARLKSPKQIQKWLDDPSTAMRNFFADKNPEFSNYIKEKQADFKESRGYSRDATKKEMSAKDREALNKIRPKLRAEYKPSADEMKIIETASNLPNSTYLTASNLAELSETHPEIYKAYTAFIRTATRSKALETDEPYYYGDSTRDNGNGIIVSDSFIEAVNRENGMRFSSWSDWRIQHLLDWITAVIENSVRGAAMHGYTKYGDEVRVLGKTGMMFNLSGVAGTQTGLNDDGSLNFHDTESIDINEAIELREEFPETAGLQCIGVSKDHILALLRSDIIDYVIPYHTSGLNATLRRMGNIYGWADFTSTQHAAEDKSIKKENAADSEHWHQEPVFSEFFVGYDTGLDGVEAMQKSAENYKRMCKERGLKPKFLEFANEPGYWKLLIDRKMVNQKTNTLIKQKPVAPNFDFGVIKGIVDKYVANYDSGLEQRAFTHIVENWDNIPKRIRDLKKQGGTKAKSTKKAIDTLANETLAVFPKETASGTSATEVKEFVDHMRGLVKAGGWRVGDVVDYVDEHPELDFIERIHMKDKTVKADLAKFLAGIDDFDTLAAFRWYMSRAYLNISPNWDGTVIYRGAVRTFTNAVDKRAKEIMAAKVGGTNLEIKNHMSSVEEVEKLFNELNSNEDIGELSKKVFATAKKLGVNIRFANTMLAKGQGIQGVATGDMVEYKTNYFNDESKTNQDKAETLLHELIHACTNYAIQLHEKGMLRDIKLKQAVEGLQKIYEQVKSDPDFDGYYGKTDIYEMVAELSNTKFAEQLQKKNLWQRVLDWISNIFGIYRGANLYENAMICLDYMLDNPNFTEYKNYAMSQRRLARLGGEDVFGKTERPDGTVMYSERDSSYLDAVNRGDMETAQRMVDEAAKEAGYTVKGLHATNAEFTVFDINKTSAENFHGKGIYFTNSVRDVENNYENYEGPDPWQKIDGRAYELAYDKYGISYEDTLTSDSEIIDKLNECYDIAIDEFKKSGRRITAYLRFDNPLILEKGMQIPNDYAGYDGIVDKQVYENIGHSGMDENTIHYVVFNPNNIKSADPVTYDDDGNVIPLSERFKSENSDIRYSDRDSYREGLSEEDRKVADKVISSLKQQKMASTYGVRNLATYTADRMSYEIQYSSAQGDPDYAHAYITWVNPLDFVYATTTMESVRERLKEEAGKLDIDRLRNQRQAIYLNVDFKTGQILGHEGRHRMLALWDAGIDRVAVIIDAKNDEYWHTKPIEMMHLKGQKFEEYRTGTDFFLHNLLPLSERYASVAEELFAHDSKGGVRFQERESTSVSNRSLLANALESVAQNDIERQKLAEYKAKIAQVEAEQKKLTEIRAEANELRFTKGRTAEETKRMRELDAEATKIANRISTYDKQLLGLESTKALKGVLEREKANLKKRLEAEGRQALKEQRQKNAEAVKGIVSHYQESRKKAVEGRNKTAMRHKIQKTLKRLNKLFKGSKERNVKEDMKDTVATALALGEILFNNEISNRDIVRLGVESVTENESKLLNEYHDLLIKKEANDERIESIRKGEIKPTSRPYLSEVEEQNRKIEARIAKLNKELSDVFARERIRLTRTSVSTLIYNLATEYHSLQESKDDYIKRAYSADLFTKLIDLKKEMDGVTARDMSMAQLEKVDKVFTMLEHSIRTANQYFRDGKFEDLETSASTIMGEIDRLEDTKQISPELAAKAKAFLWNELTPYHAFDKIGSETLMKYYVDLLKGQGVAARDAKEARLFAAATREKYGYGKWKLDEVYNFKLKDGRTFSTTLKHLLSVYAYSKRDQAESHMQVGGFFHNDKATFRKEKGVLKMVRTDAVGYKVDADILEEIKKALGKEKMGYVDEMLVYLTKMGEKGNEVTRVMWGVDIFTEKVYFPLKSKDDFLKKSNEPAKAVSLKNDGMTQETKPGASNPIVLEAFDDVWANHVERMSQYHGMVIPIDNLNKVLHYGKWADTDSVSVSTKLEGKFTSAATDYLEQLIDDLNGGVASKGVTNPFWGFFGKWKKTKVGASLSTVVQQPTAILRAMAEIDAKYFVGKPNLSRLSKQVEEMQTYAPIAIIKEIGGFDAGAGKQMARWINSDTLTGIDKVSDIIDNFSMWGAEKADQIGWVAIWEAVKRETKATTDLEYGSEEFLERCGERVTEVINKTQVYDSVLSRSGFMRSKNDSVKMLTSFMGEPTLSMNMLYSAVINAKRGGKEEKLKAARTIGYVYASIILAEALAASIYALRDDDEDESYLEKYLQALGEGILSDIVFAPITSLPGVKDVVSIFQGWNVDRSDMAIFADIKNAFDGLDSESKSTYRKIEDFSGAIAAAFGLPLKNVLRTGREIYNVVENIADGIIGTNGTNPLLEGITGKESSKSSDLYNAIVKGDTARLNVYEKGYKTTDSYTSAIRKALRENDPRIGEAARARYEGNISEYTRIAREIVSEGHFKQDDVVAAINAEMNAIKKNETPAKEETEEKDEATSIYSASDINVAFENRDDDMALKIINDLVATKVANGKTEKEAKSSLRSSMTSYWKPMYKQAYQSGDSAEMLRIRKILLASGLYGSSSDVVKTVKDWLKN